MFESPSSNGESRASSVEHADGKSLHPRCLEGVKILLVDDSLDNRTLFCRILVKAGARVHLANDGAIAVDMQSVESYDVIVMDIRMPVLNGYEATSLIREQGYQGPIIALTAHATPGEEERCRRAGCSHFYLKPIDRHGLLSAVLDSLHLEN